MTELRLKHLQGENSKGRGWLQSLFHVEWKELRSQESVVLPRNRTESSPAELASVAGSVAGSGAGSAVASSHKGCLHLNQLKGNEIEHSLSRLH